MILEYAQMLSSAVRFCGIDEGYRCSKSQMNHPCSVWVRESLDNWLYLRALQYYLHEEWCYRRENYWGHLAYLKVYSLDVPPLPKIGFTQRPVLVPDYCLKPTIAQSYREYFIREKRHLATWTKRPVPNWFK